MGSILIDGHKLSQLDRKYSHDSAKFREDQNIFALNYENTHNYKLPHTVYWDFLVYRRNLDPHRFDRYHPCIGELIERSEHHHMVGVPNPGPPPIVTQSVPEPSSWVMFLIAISLMTILSCRAWDRK